jgi:hypothetical protein
VTISYNFITLSLGPSPDPSRSLSAPKVVNTILAGVLMCRSPDQG